MALSTGRPPLVRHRERLSRSATLGGAEAPKLLDLHRPPESGGSGGSGIGSKIATGDQILRRDDPGSLERRAGGTASSKASDPRRRLGA
jgi:hypothetical protein